MISDTFLEQFASKYRWNTAPTKRRFRFRKNVNKGMREMHRMALTMRGVIDRSLDDLEGLQASDYSTYQIFERGDLVFKLIDLENIKTSRVGLVPRRGIMSSAYIRLIPTSPDTDSRFYSWFFFAVYFNNIFNGMGGGVRQNLTPTDLLEFPIPVPDLPTQRAIAEFLDRETARIDSLIEKKQRLVELWGEHTDAEVSKIIFQSNGEKDNFVETGVDWLGHIPASWQLSRVGWELQRITYGFTNPMPTEDEGPFLLTANDVNYGRILWKTARRTSQQAFDHDLTDKSRPKKGDVLITKDGTLGRVAIHDGRPACINQSVALLRPRENRVSSEFLANVLLSRRYQDRMIFEAGGTTIKHIYISRLQKMPFPVPPPQEQSEINQRIGATRRHVQRLEEGINTSIDRLKEYRSALITSAVTGQIDVSTYARSGTTDRQLDVIQSEMQA